MVMILMKLKQLWRWQKNSQKPTAIIAHTVKGKGISFMENEIEWHGKAPNRKEMEQALRELGGH